MDHDVRSQRLHLWFLAGLAPLSISWPGGVTVSTPDSESPRRAFCELQDKSAAPATSTYQEPSMLLMDRDSLPECSKGVDSSSTGAILVGSNPTAVKF